MSTPVKSKGLDRIDISILDTLQRDGRIANVDLAKKQIGILEGGQQRRKQPFCVEPLGSLIWLSRRFALG